MKIFVTGGTGFIGKPLVKLLVDQGHNVYVLTRNAEACQKKSSLLEYVQGNLKDVYLVSYLFEEIQPQVLIHLAWEGLPDYSQKVSCQNLNYGINIFSIAANTGCSTIISTGSCWEYEGREGKIAETCKLNSSSLFPAVKNSLRLIGKAIASENRIKFYWLRLFYVYGPGQRGTSLIPYLLHTIKDGKTFSINNPNNKNDFVFVEDVARAIACVIDTNPDKTTYNVGSGYLTSIKDIIYYLYFLFDIDIEKQQVADMIQINSKNQNHKSEAFFSDIFKIRQYTGWKPDHSIKSGIKIMYDAFSASQ